jgi:hypothetical protein
MLIFSKVTPLSFTTPVIQWRSQVFDPGGKTNFVRKSAKVSFQFVSFRKNTVITPNPTFEPVFLKRLSAPLFSLQFGHCMFSLGAPYALAQGCRAPVPWLRHCFSTHPQHAFTIHNI